MDKARQIGTNGTHPFRGVPLSQPRCAFFLTLKEQPVDKCSECGSEHLKIGITNTQSGSTVYPVYCGDCGEVSNKYIKKQIALQHAIENGILQYVKTKTAKYMEEDGEQIKCEVCNANEGEYHHWAPQYLFPDANKWPTSYLCRACHRKWHDLVTPNMSIKK